MKTFMKIVNTVNFAKKNVSDLSSARLNLSTAEFVCKKLRNNASSSKLHLSALMPQLFWTESSDFLSFVPQRHDAAANFTIDGEI